MCAVHLFMANACVSHKHVKEEREQGLSCRETVCVDFFMNALITRTFLSDSYGINSVW